jgi:acyl-CoA synthetase (AMP-forming)/AMP-acid ligase II
MARESLISIVRGHAAANPQAQAVGILTESDSAEAADWWSYADLDLAARRVAATLRRECTPGDRVVLAYPSGLPFAAAFLGSLYAGLVAVPAPMPGRYAHQQRRLAAIVADAGAAVVATDEANLPEVLGWAGAQAVPAICLATDTAEVVAGPPIDDPAESPEPDEPAILQYTSGSTGNPKGVIITHRNVLHNGRALIDMFGFGPGTTMGGWLPLFHDMGLLGMLTPALLAGGRCIMAQPVDFIKRPYLWLRMVDRWDVDFSAAPNFAYQLCARTVTDEQIAGLDLSRWKYAANGSEPIQAAALEAFADRFARYGLRPESLTPCYGMAESTVFVTGSRHGRPTVITVDPDELAAHRLRPAATGRRLVGCGTGPHQEIRIVDPETTAALPDGEIGEIWMRGDSVSPGYWGNATATAATFGNRTGDEPQHYLRSGDLGVLHDGHLYITGRIKETLIVHGRNLYPTDIEHELRAHHPQLGDVGAVFTVPLARDEPGDEHGVVLTHEVSGRPSADQLAATASAMRQTVFREFGVRVAAVALLRRGSTPRTTSGKIQRTVVRQMYLAGELQPLHHTTDPAQRPAPVSTPATAS